MAFQVSIKLQFSEVILQMWVEKDGSSSTFMEIIGVREINLVHSKSSFDLSLIVDESYLHNAYY